MQAGPPRGSTGVLSPSRAGRSLKEMSINSSSHSGLGKGKPERRDLSPAPKSIQLKCYSPAVGGLGSQLSQQQFLPPAIKPPSSHITEVQPTSQIQTVNQSSSQPKGPQSPSRVIVKQLQHTPVVSDSQSESLKMDTSVTTTHIDPLKTTHCKQQAVSQPKRAQSPVARQSVQRQQARSESTKVVLPSQQANSQPKRAQSPVGIRTSLQRAGSEIKSISVSQASSQPRRAQSPVSDRKPQVNKIKSSTSLPKRVQSPVGTRTSQQRPVTDEIKSTSMSQATSQPKRAQSPSQLQHHSVVGDEIKSSNIRMQSLSGRGRVRSPVKTNSSLISTKEQQPFGHQRLPSPRRVPVPKHNKIQSPSLGDVSHLSQQVVHSRTMSPMKVQSPRNVEDVRKQTREDSPASIPATHGIGMSSNNVKQDVDVHPSIQNIKKTTCSTTSSPRRLGKVTARISEGSSQMLMKILSEAGTEPVSSTREILQSEGETLSLYRTKVMRKHFTTQKRREIIKKREDLQELMSQNEGWTEMLGNLERQELGLSAAAAWSRAGDANSFEDTIALLRSVSNYYTKIMGSICTESRVVSLEGLGVILLESQDLLSSLSDKGLSSTSPLVDIDTLSSLLHDEISQLSEGLPNITKLSADVASRQMQLLQQAAVNKLIE